MKKIFCDRCGTECSGNYCGGGFFVKHLRGHIYNYLCPSCNEYVVRGMEEEERNVEKAVSKAERKARKLL